MIAGQRQRQLFAKLLLEDGTMMEGVGFGHPTKVVGEVVFNTGMVGYTEALTDPSYRGQIVCFTYPLIGNYGVPSYSLRDEFNLPLHFESDKIQANGLIVHEASGFASHWASTKTLDEWLLEEGIPGVSGIDTRALTKKTRDQGVMMGTLEVSENEIEEDSLFKTLEKSPKYDDIDFMSEVSTKNVVKYESPIPNKGTVVLIDCGVKYGMIRNLLLRGYSVVRLPHNATLSQVMEYRPNGVLLSNGPGEPKNCRHAIQLAGELLEARLPTLGICLGHQILALASGGSTFKLKYGHRGQNKPCIDTNGNSYVTSQNHGYAVDPETLEGTGFDAWFINADDGTNEGIINPNARSIAVQFHPEASPGPSDTIFVFDIFQTMMEGKRVEVVSHAKT